MLYLEKIPLLDRRVLAVILRNCHAITMIGIYECPMLHFGDVLCILDLIHEINEERNKTGRSPIRGFDFSPRFHSGMPFEHRYAATYGLSWGTQDRDVVQRGFYMILMKAYLKAKALDLELLFNEDKAFMRYLARLPFDPLGACSFLSALQRHLELDPAATNYQDLRFKSMFDLVKPVRLGLTRGLNRFLRDWPQRYMNLGQDMEFCTSCGYETLPMFFSEAQRGLPAEQRRCAGCLMQRVLDLEADHLKQGKLIVVNALFPAWDGSKHNPDAPLADGSRDLIFLKTTTSEAPPPPGLQINAAGYPYQPSYTKPQVRDNKCHFDSMQDLPTLDELVPENCHSMPEWMQADVDARLLDGYRIAMRAFAAEAPPGLLENVEIFHQYRMDPIHLDCFDEEQPPTDSAYVSGEFETHDYAGAERFHKHLARVGW